MNIYVYPVGQLVANCYIIEDQKKHGVLIDPGDDAEYLISMIESSKIKPEAILLTHGHFDHILAVYEISQFFHAPVWMHEKDIFLLKRMNSSVRTYLKYVRYEGPIPHIENIINGPINIVIYNMNYQVIEAPGHTPGSVCFLLNNKYLFSGDTIFAYGAIGRTDFEYSDYLLIKKSMVTLSKLEEDIIVYPGHGQITTIGEFKKEFQNI